jgi:hypothetical protein
VSLLMDMKHSTSLLDKTEMGQHFAGEQSLDALTFGVLEPRMHIWASDLWKSDMIAYRSVGHSPALGSLGLWVDLLPPLNLHKNSGNLVLERSKVGKSCLHECATSYAIAVCNVKLGVEVAS